MPHLLAAILTDVLSTEADVAVLDVDAAVRPGCTPPSLLDAVVGSRADVVIVGTHAHVTSRAVATVLARCPWVRVLMIAGEGRECSLAALLPQEIALGGLSAAGLRDVVRAPAFVRPSPPAEPPATRPSDVASPLGADPDWRRASCGGEGAGDLRDPGAPVRPHRQ
jgi:hypothetical protein